MRSALVIISVLALAAAIGCASQGARIAAPDSNDPAWVPPGEMVVTMSAPSTPTNGNLNTTAQACPQPNRTEIKGKQIRAAADHTMRR